VKSEHKLLEKGIQGTIMSILDLNRRLWLCQGPFLC